MAKDSVRIMIEIDRDVHDRMVNVVPRGLRRTLLRNLINSVVDVAQSDGMIGLGAILDNQFSVTLDPSRPSEPTGNVKT